MERAVLTVHDAFQAADGFSPGKHFEQARENDLAVPEHSQGGAGRAKYLLGHDRERRAPEDDGGIGHRAHGLGQRRQLADEKTGDAMSLLSMFRTDRPMTSGFEAAIPDRTTRSASFSNIRSRSRTR